MDKPPGMSIFNGGDSIQINNSNDEDEEELLEKIRLKNDLQNQLETAFDDLFEPEDTLNHSNTQLSSICGEPPRFGYETPKNHIGGGDENHSSAGKFEIISLRNQLESKTREFEYVSSKLDDERRMFESKIKELERRLLVSEADKVRSEKNCTQTHELLVEAKTQVSELADSVQKLEKRCGSAEMEKAKLKGDLDSMKTMLSDVQLKYNMIEKNGQNRLNDKHTDALVLQNNERFNAKIAMMDQQIDTLQRKYDEKSSEVKGWEIRFQELQRSREGMLIEKTETINHLERALDECQNRCQQLMAKPDFTQENTRLERLAAGLERQIGEMQSTINSLTQKLEQTSSELDMMDTVFRDSDFSDSIRRVSHPGRNHNGESLEDRVSIVKSELYRCLSSQKQKREKIKRLEQQLDERDEEMKKLKVEFNLTRERVRSLEIQIREVENEKIDNEMVKSLQSELETARNRNKSLEKFVETSETKYNDLRKANEMEKEQIEAQNRHSDKLCRMYQKEIESLNQHLERYRTQIDDLTEKLKLGSENEIEIDELKRKALKFEEALSAKSSTRSRDQSVSTSPELEQNSSREIESRLRGEFAKSFAKQLKSTEDQYSTKLQQYGKGIELLKTQLSSMCEQYEKKVTEMQLLKNVILVEREKTTEIIAHKDGELKKYLDACQTELKNCERKIEELELSLKEKESQVESERGAMKVVLQQYTNERDSIKKSEEELRKRIKELETEKEEVVKKYETMKKSFQKCKVWADEKEKHMVNEYNRIRQGYEKVMETVKERVRTFIQNQQQKVSDDEAMETMLAQFHLDYHNKLKPM